MSRIDGIGAGKTTKKTVAGKKVKPRMRDIVKKEVLKAKDKLLELQKKYLPSKPGLKPGGLKTKQTGIQLRDMAPHGKNVKLEKPKWGVRLP